MGDTYFLYIHFFQGFYRLLHLVFGSTKQMKASNYGIDIFLPGKFLSMIKSVNNAMVSATKDYY